MPNFRDVDDYLEDAWAELHDANARLDWFIGMPSYDPHRIVPWSQYAFDPSEKHRAGKRTLEWTATAPTEIAVVRAMALALRQIAAGSVPK